MGGPGDRALSQEWRLRRLKATPLTPFEFLTAQVLSRLLVVMAASLFIYVGVDLLLDFPMRGSYAALVLIYAAGALCLISLGLIVASRWRTEELANGVLNLISWPLLLLSGVWFSMEGTSGIARFLSQLSPLTHLVAAARRVMIDGAQVVDVLPQVSSSGPWRWSLSASPPGCFGGNSRGGSPPPYPG